MEVSKTFENTKIKQNDKFIYNMIFFDFLLFFSSRLNYGLH
jgi:hypothetical protein